MNIFDYRCHVDIAHVEDTYHVIMAVQPRCHSMTKLGPTLSIPDPRPPLSFPHPFVYIHKFGADLNRDFPRS